MKSYHREEGENHSWTHHQRDYILSTLKTLSFEELQIVEMFSNNEYLRKSANVMLNYYKVDNNLEICKKIKTRRL